MRTDPSPRSRRRASARRPTWRELGSLFDRDLAADALAAVVGAFAFGWLGSEAVFLGAFLGGTMSRSVRLLVRGWKTRTIWGVSGAVGLSDIWHLAHAPSQGAGVAGGSSIGASAAAQGVAVLVASGCAAAAVTAAQPVLPDALRADGGKPLLARQLAGHWRKTGFTFADQHYFRVRGASFEAAYDWDDGRMVGTIEGNRVRGWWTETPSRQPPADAGKAEFRLVKTRRGIELIGTWGYGDEAPSRPWTLIREDAEVPTVLRGAFDEKDSFVAQPP